MRGRNEDPFPRATTTTICSVSAAIAAISALTKTGFVSALWAVQSAQKSSENTELLTSFSNNCY